MNRVVGVNGTGGREDTKQKVSQDVIHIVTFKFPRTFKFKMLRSSLRLIKLVFSGIAIMILRVFCFDLKLVSNQDFFTTFCRLHYPPLTLTFEIWPGATETKVLVFCSIIWVTMGHPSVVLGHSKVILGLLGVFWVPCIQSLILLFLNHFATIKENMLYASSNLGGIPWLIGIFSLKRYTN